MNESSPGPSSGSPANPSVLTAFDPEEFEGKDEDYHVNEEEMEFNEDFYKIAILEENFKDFVEKSKDSAEILQQFNLKSDIAEMTGKYSTQRIEEIFSTANLTSSMNFALDVLKISVQLLNKMNRKIYENMRVQGFGEKVEKLPGANEPSILTEKPKVEKDDLFPVISMEIPSEHEISMETEPLYQISSPKIDLTPFKLIETLFPNIFEDSDYEEPSYPTESTPEPDEMNILITNFIPRSIDNQKIYSLLEKLSKFTDLKKSSPHIKQYTFYPSF